MKKLHQPRLWEVFIRCPSADVWRCRRRTCTRRSPARTGAFALLLRLGLPNVLLGGTPGALQTAIPRPMGRRSRPGQHHAQHPKLLRILPISSVSSWCSCFSDRVFAHGSGSQRTRDEAAVRRSIVCFERGAAAGDGASAVKSRAGRASGTRSRRVSDGGDAGLDVLSHRAHDGPGVLAVFSH